MNKNGKKELHSYIKSKAYLKKKKKQQKKTKKITNCIIMEFSNLGFHLTVYIIR